MSSTLDEIFNSNKESKKVSEKDKRYIARPLETVPLVVKSGFKEFLIDEDGREILDLTSGWNVLNTGWNHPKIVGVLQKQIKSLTFAPAWCTHKGRADLAERINTILGERYKILCTVTGSEAVETALKIARIYTGRYGIVGFTNAYHGGTLGSMLAGGVPGFEGTYMPKDTIHRRIPMFDHYRYPEVDYLKEIEKAILTPPYPAAIILEPIFTNPGVFYAKEEVYIAIQECCKKVGTLIIMDEVGTGFGRTGKMFGFQHFKIDPDIICVAKAISSGAVPMSAAIMKENISKCILRKPGFCSTFAWSPLACAAAMATLDIIEDEQLSQRAHTLGILALNKLDTLKSKSNIVANIRGKGLELGIELVDRALKPLKPNVMKDLTKRILARSIFLETSSCYTSSLLIMPPLIIREDNLLTALESISEEILGLEKEFFKEGI